jgi:hypothetical protein
MVVAQMRSAVGPLEVCGSAVLSFAVKLWCEVMQCAVVWGVEGILCIMVCPVVGSPPTCLPRYLYLCAPSAVVGSELRPGAAWCRCVCGDGGIWCYERAAGSGWLP